VGRAAADRLAAQQGRLGRGARAGALGPRRGGKGECDRRAGDRGCAQELPPIHVLVHID
jgi:hypothetical protein